MTTPTTSTTCCIIGGGPAGVMLGFLLARSGVPVTVLEKHLDFFRDFRGDTIHPSTLQLLHELGLLERFLQLPHTQIDHISANIGGRSFPIADFRHLPTAGKFIALMPQWDFLNFLSAEAAKLPNFTLRMGWEATSLTQNETTNQITGVTAQTPDGPHHIKADLVVGCDGRHATSVAAAHLNVIEEGVPIDVLWLSLPRHSTDPMDGLGYINYGRLLVLINRNDYYQCGYIIRKGSYPEIQQSGLPAFRASIERIAPFLAGRTAELDSWDHVAWDHIKLLTIQINHLEQWSIPGLLCIGDAAHAMSPVGGIGINIALQDAVAAANILADPLRTHTLTDWHLRRVQTYRTSAVRRTQQLQIQAHKFLNRTLQNPGPVTPPLSLRIVTRIPGFQYLAARIIGMGFQPEHIRNIAHPSTP